MLGYAVFNVVLRQAFSRAANATYAQSEVREDRPRRRSCGCRLR